MLAFTGAPRRVHDGLVQDAGAAVVGGGQPGAGRSDHGVSREAGAAAGNLANAGIYVARQPLFEWIPQGDAVTDFGHHVPPGLAGRMRGYEVEGYWLISARPPGSPAPRPSGRGSEGLMVISKTPLRVSFAGGGTDFREDYRDGMGRVISMAIDRHMYVTVNTRFDHTIRVATRSRRSLTT